MNNFQENDAFSHNENSIIKVYGMVGTEMDC